MAFTVYGEMEVYLLQKEERLVCVAQTMEDRGNVVNAGEELLWFWCCSNIELERFEVVFLMESVFGLSVWMWCGRFVEEGGGFKALEKLLN